MPLYHYGCISKQSRLVCALWFRRAGGCLRERSSTNVSRHENDSYGAQGYAVVWSALTPNEVRSFHHAQIPAGQRAGNLHQGRHRVPTSIAAAKQRSTTHSNSSTYADGSLR